MFVSLRFWWVECGLWGDVPVRGKPAAYMEQPSLFLFISVLQKDTKKDFLSMQTEEAPSEPESQGGFILQEVCLKLKWRQ